MRRMLLLIGIAAGVWPVVAVGAYQFRGIEAFWVSGIAMLLCVVPAAISLAWTSYSWRRSPDQQLVSLLGGTGFRLFATLGGAYAVEQTAPFLRDNPGTGFWIWLGAFYLLTLALETALSITGRSERGETMLTGGGAQPAHR